MSAALIDQRIQAYLADQSITGEVDIEDPDGQHFKIRVVSNGFENMTPINRQQLIYKALGDVFTTGAVHAVELFLFTESEWDKAKVFYN